MLRYSRGSAEGVSRRFGLLEVFRHTVADMHQQHQEDSEAVGWDLLAPKGSIYLLNALEAEHLKHQEDLQHQFAELAEQFKPLLEASLEAGCDQPAEPSSRPPHYRLLLQHLRRSPVTDVQGDPELGGVRGQFLPLTEFLMSSGTSRSFCDLVLLPSDPEKRRRSVKNRLLALLIMIIQVCGPVLLLLHSLQDEEVRNTYVKALPRRFATLSSTMHEVVCIESVQKATITAMGAFLLALFIDIAHSYSHTQFRNAMKEIILPCDRFWVNLGEFTNMWCIFWSVLAMPLLFLEESSAKDVLYDSLGMLFIFTLDDFCGGSLDYLRLDDEKFQRMSCWTMGALIQCPRKISDVVDPTATSLSELFCFSLCPDGLQSTSGPDAGQPCKTRLMEDTSEQPEADEKTPLQPLDPLSAAAAAAAAQGAGRRLPYLAQTFKYCVRHTGGPGGEPKVFKLDAGRASFKVLAWRVLAGLL